MNKIIIIFFLLFAIKIEAQEIKSLTLKDAIIYALDNKSEAKKSKLKVENSTYQIQEARSRALPQIFANGSLTYNPVLQTTVIDGDYFGQPGTMIEASFGQKWSTGAGIILTQNLFDQSIFIGLKAAKTTREFYQINDQLTKEQVIERVANNYYQVYVLRQRLILVENNLKTTTKVRDIVKGQFENGLAKKIDLDRMNVNISNISTQKQQVINAVQLQENTLKFYMGMQIDTQINIPEFEFEIKPTVLTNDLNKTNRSEYLLLKKQEELLGLQKKSIISEFYPTLSLSANYNYIGQGSELPWGANSDDDVYWSNFSSIGLNLKIPIFSGFRTRAKVKQADVQLRSIKEDVKNTQLLLDLEYKNATTQIENSVITLQNQKENMALADEILKNINNNYVLGLASLTDLLDAENAYTTAQNNYTAAILDYKLAEIQLIKSKGELNTLIN
ncbi:TolC family protein [Polaribacter undariae]|uniref:TolC family protein n=1 Tax=Polaribacter sejongensis TaxID=985043 RepID=A0AAJ1QXS2_9FLAO|nr:TolC family protein [Polaribacter undariae]MDN3619561.1 TolC family protein [Polaribacter undariae]UWD32325.1 TolC family protein [Polaribacter undariae]